MSRHNTNSRDELAILFTNNGLYTPLVGATNRMNLLRGEAQGGQKRSESMEATQLFQREGMAAGKKNAQIAAIDAAAASVGQPTVAQMSKQRRIMFGCNEEADPTSKRMQCRY